MTFTLCTAPNGPNNCQRTFSSVSGAKLYTNIHQPAQVTDVPGDDAVVGIMVLVPRRLVSSGEYLKQKNTYEPHYEKTFFRVTDQGPVQSIVSLTTSLRHQLVKYMLITYATTPLFFAGKMQKNAKDSHIFSTKNNSVFVIFTFKILVKS